MPSISGRYRRDNCDYYTLVNKKTKTCDYEWFWMSSDEAYDRNQWLIAYGSENLVWTSKPEKELSNE